MDKESAVNIARKYIDYLVESKHEITKAPLFGSYATYKYNDNSDIDIAVVFRKLKNRFDEQVKLIMMTAKIDTRIEPHPLSTDDINLHNPFAHDIINHRIRVY